MRRLLTRTVSTLALSATAFVAPVASAELAWSNSTDRYVDIAEVSGALDRIEADFLQRSVKGADADPQVELLVIQLNSARATLDRASLSAVIDTINDADVPIAVWIGPGQKGTRRTRSCCDSRSGRRDLHRRGRLDWSVEGRRHT